MRPLISSVLASGVVAGFLIAGSAAFAQHGGFGGSRGGFAGHDGGFSNRGYSSAIAPLSPHAIVMPGRSVFTPGQAVFPAPAHAFVSGILPQSGPAFQPAWRGRGEGQDGYRDRDYDRGYGRGGYGFIGGYPIYANSWELLPYDLGSSDFDSETDQGSAQSTVTVPPPETGYRPAYAGDQGEPYPAPEAYAAPSAPAAPVAPEPELTLIFKDGHTQAIRNYVLTPNDLVDLDEAATGREKRIPLDKLNLPATEKAAQQAGLDFSPPV